MPHLFKILPTFLEQYSHCRFPLIPFVDKLTHMNSLYIPTLHIRKVNLNIVPSPLLVAKLFLLFRFSDQHFPKLLAPLVSGKEQMLPITVTAWFET
jgi:hypothetical protein